ncbi:MAG: hypothetical protein M2R45_04949 [Verrucomicrobia subdivision 3 bacterium]|nr:hypothetical protein [Limisphaerales bacterium]MCS1415614.1 hypothetical protein [Limisphaerales bacterium]
MRNCLGPERWITCCRNECIWPGSVPINSWDIDEEQFWVVSNGSQVMESFERDPMKISDGIENSFMMNGGGH